MLSKKIIKIVFCLYFICLFLVIVLKFSYGNSINFVLSFIEPIKVSREAGFWNINVVPFKTLIPYISDLVNGHKSFETLESYIILNLVGNTIAFLPLGFFVPKVFSLKFYKSMLYCILVIISFEIIEFIFMIGFFDVDDIIINMLGCMTGYLIHKIIHLERILEKFIKKIESISISRSKKF